MKGAGSDISGSVDEFQYAYRRVDGDVDIVARVTAVQRVDAWTKSGVMIRDALTSNATHFSMFVTPREGIAFQRRPIAGGGSILTTASTARAPFWVRLERRGASITAFQSSDGNAWTQVGTGTMTLPSVYVGLAVTSHKASRAATALFDNVTVRTPAANLPPSVSLTAPANGASFPANTSITVSANASDTDGTIASVSFYRGTTLIATDTTSPYSVTWTNVPTGTYSLTAEARDDDGATTMSAARSITVGAPPPVQRRAVFVASSNHNTAVDRYVLNIYAAGANPDTATPVATRDMGKPAVVGGECDVDISQTVQSLASGSYIATVTAVGPGGSARSAPASFSR